MHEGVEMDQLRRNMKTLTGRKWVEVEIQQGSWVVWIVWYGCTAKRSGYEIPKVIFCCFILGGKQVVALVCSLEHISSLKRLSRVDRVNVWVISSRQWYKITWIRA